MLRTPSQRQTFGTAEGIAETAVPPITGIGRLTGAVVRGEGELALLWRKQPGERFSTVAARDAAELSLVGLGVYRQACSSAGNPPLRLPAGEGNPNDLRR